jgi:hypothetical protein
MSRKTKRFTMQDVNGHERVVGEYARRQVQELAAIEPALIAAIVAIGPLDMHDEFVAATIEKFASQNTEADKMSAVRTACNAHDVSDELTSVEISLAESGYLLGLAVGLALGSGQPFALKGGAR